MWSAVVARLKTFKVYVGKAPKGMLVFGAIGLCSLATAIFLVLSNNPSPTILQTGTQPTTTDSARPGSQPSQSQAANTPVGSNTQTAANNVAGVSTTAGTTPGTSSSTPASANVPKNSSANNPNTTTPTPPNQPTPPKADYNLNENWYFATASTGGLYNTCWPTELTEDNEAHCADINSIYSYPHTRFIGIGISKNPDTAQALAASQARDKALAQHVDPRLGGGDDAVLLTEALCAQYDLSCGRW